MWARLQCSDTKVTHMSFFNELKRRNVLWVGTAYIVAAWLLIQIAETIFPLFGFGDTPARIVVILLAIGFPLFLLFSWVFELTPQGLRRETDVERSASTTRSTGKQLDRVIIVLLTLALGYFAVDKFVLEPARVTVLMEETAQQARSDALTSMDTHQLVSRPGVSGLDEPACLAVPSQNEPVVDRYRFHTPQFARRAPSKSTLTVK